LSTIITVIWNPLITSIWPGIVGESKSGFPNIVPFFEAAAKKYKLDWKLDGRPGVSGVALEPQSKELHGRAGNDDAYP
jgi:hypothetical protein